MTQAVSEVTYANGVTLKTKTANGWPVIDADGTEHVFASIPAFIAWCEANYSWPLEGPNNERI